MHEFKVGDYVRVVPERQIMLQQCMRGHHLAGLDVEGATGTVDRIWADRDHPIAVRFDLRCPVWGTQWTDSFEASELVWLAF